MSYVKFGKLVRPNILEANPGAVHTKINALLGALWGDYKKQREKLGQPILSTEKGSKNSKRPRSPRGGVTTTTKKKVKSNKSPVTVPSVSFADRQSLMLLVHYKSIIFYSSRILNIVSIMYSLLVVHSLYNYYIMWLKISLYCSMKIIKFIHCFCCSYVCILHVFHVLIVLGSYKKISTIRGKES